MLYGLAELFESFREMLSIGYTELDGSPKHAEKDARDEVGWASPSLYPIKSPKGTRAVKHARIRRLSTVVRDFRSQMAPPS